MTALCICLILMVICTVIVVGTSLYVKKADSLDGYLDIVEDVDGTTAMLLELANPKVVNKKKVTLVVRKSQKIQGL